MGGHPPGGRRATRRAALRRAGAALGDATRRLAERLAYRPREVSIVTLLAVGLVAGLAVARWRDTYPALAAHLEAEPARLIAPGASPVRLRPRPVPRRAPRECGESRDAGAGPAGARAAPLDPSP